MTSIVKLNGSLPVDDANGLAAHGDALVNASDEIRVVIMLVSTKTLKTSVDTGAVTAELRVRRAEMIPDSDLRMARQLFRRAHESRTGRVALPFDVEEEINSAFKTES